MALFGDKEVHGPRMLVEVMSQCFGGSLWRGGSLRAVHVGGSDVTVFWWLALSRKQFTAARVSGSLVPNYGWHRFVVSALRAVCFDGSHYCGVIIFCQAPSRQLMLVMMPFPPWCESHENMFGLFYSLNMHVLYIRCFETCRKRRYLV